MSERGGGKGAFRCPRCGEITSGAMRSCPECGQKLTLECPECGQTCRHIHGYNFCPNCGVRLMELAGEGLYPG